MYHAHDQNRICHQQNLYIYKGQHSLLTHIRYIWHDLYKEERPTKSVMPCKLIIPPVMCHNKQICHVCHTQWQHCRIQCLYAYYMKYWAYSTYQTERLLTCSWFLFKTIGQRNSISCAQEISWDWVLRWLWGKGGGFFNRNSPKDNWPRRLWYWKNSV